VAGQVWHRMAEGRVTGGQGVTDAARRRDGRECWDGKMQGWREWLGRDLRESHSQRASRSMERKGCGAEPTHYRIAVSRVDSSAGTEVSGREGNWVR
jgi:hypothetical protein